MNIKNLQMWKNICADTRIGVSKSLFGLRTTATYLATGSPLSGKIIEYSPADGEHLKRILETPPAALTKAIGNFSPKRVVNGNYMAEVCVAADASFVAVQLHQFSHMSYEPVTDVMTYEGEAARALAPVFSM